MANAYSVIVVGPPGCGKTTNGDRIRRFFRLDRVLDVDGFDSRPPSFNPRFGAVFLCIETSDLPRYLGGIAHYDYAEVMAAMKEQRAPVKKGGA